MVALGQSSEPTHRVTDAVGNHLDVVLPIIVDTIPVDTTTTTTVPTTTTTTTLPSPSGSRFDIIVRGSLLTGENVTLWEAPYFRSLPYTAGVGWDDGDRVGYRCTYMHLVRHNGEGRSDDDVLGRVWFTNFSEAENYAIVNDRFMESAIRYFDGTPYTGSQVQLNDCPGPTVAYEPYTGLDERPRIDYVASSLLEVRDYGPTVAHEGVTFELHDHITEPFTAVGELGQDPHTVYERVVVIAYLDRGDGVNLPAMPVYYDSLDPEVDLVVTP